jgi:CBS domain-containing protein
VTAIVATGGSGCRSVSWVGQDDADQTSQHTTGSLALPLRAQAGHRGSLEGVQAKELARPYPTIRMDTPAGDAARLLAQRRLPALIVVDGNEHPLAILPASQVLRLMIPHYVQEDPALARVLDEAFADRICEALEGRQAADLLPRERVPLPVVAPDDTVLEIAAIMAANRCPLVAVVEERSKTAPLMGAISVAELLDRLLPGEPATESVATGS